MSSVPVVINGVLWDDADKSGKKVVLYGEASIAGLGVGGGPIYPPSGGGGDGAHPEHPIAGGPWPTPPIYYPPGTRPPGAGGGEPPSIWPSPGHPEHPIVIPPEIWPNPPEGQAPHPEHPIVIPPPEGTDGPQLEVKVIWVPPGNPNSGWQVVLVPTGPHPSPSGARGPAPAPAPSGRRR